MMDVKIIDNTPDVVRAVKKANIQTLSAAGAYIRGIARRMIKISPTVSAPGSPPHSRKGRLKDAIIFVVDNDAQILTVGVSYSAMGKLGGSHEHGGVEPPKTGNVKGANWKLELGGHGPICVVGVVGKDSLRFAKLRTIAQVERSIALSRTLAFTSPGMSIVAQTKPRVYPQRPFIGPAFEIAKARLPEMWANSVH